MNRSLKNICGRKYGGDKDEEIGKFFSSRKILTHYFSTNYIFPSCKKLFDFSAMQNKMVVSDNKNTGPLAADTTAQRPRTLL